MFQAIDRNDAGLQRCFVFVFRLIIIIITIIIIDHRSSVAGALRELLARSPALIGATNPSGATPIIAAAASVSNPRARARAPLCAGVRTGVMTVDVFWVQTL